MTDMTTTKTVTATARQAGRNVLHTVLVNGSEVVGTRRSAGFYHYAICEWITTGYDDAGWPIRRVVVRRWSKNPRASGATFAVPVSWAGVAA